MTPDRPRKSNGDFASAPDAPERDAEAFRMRSRGSTLNEIAVALGYSNATHVSVSLRRHVDRYVRPAADEYRALMDERLDHMRRETMRVLETTHYKVSDGRVIYHAPCDCPRDIYGDGGHCPHWKPLEDDSPVLAAVDRLLKIEERQAKLHGLDAPVKQRVEVANVTVKVEGADDV
jgi:hypothetical protein